MDDDTAETFVADEPAPGRLRGIGVLLLVAMAAAALLLLVGTGPSGTVQAVVTVLALALGVSGGVLLLLCRITVSSVRTTWPSTYPR